MAGRERDPDVEYRCVGCGAARNSSQPCSPPWSVSQEWVVGEGTVVLVVVATTTTEGCTLTMPVMPVHPRLGRYWAAGPKHTATVPVWLCGFRPVMRAPHQQVHDGDDEQGVDRMQAAQYRGGAGTRHAEHELEDHQREERSAQPGRGR